MALKSFRLSFANMRARKSLRRGIKAPCRARVEKDIAEDRWQRTSLPPRRTTETSPLRIFVKILPGVLCKNVLDRFK
jgi:hypothetical protein